MPIEYNPTDVAWVRAKITEMNITNRAGAFLIFKTILLTNALPKKRKMQLLLALGINRNIIAAALTNGNVGMVANAAAAIRGANFSESYSSEWFTGALREVFPNMPSLNQARTRAPRSATPRAPRQAAAPRTTAPRASVLPIRDIQFERKFGIEFECFNIPMNDVAREVSRAGVTCAVEGYNHMTRNHWKVVPDGSLAGENTFELVSPPLNGITALKGDVKKVCEKLEEIGAYINDSGGLHVHFDASDFTLQTWKNILFNYYQFEPEINRFMPKPRRDAYYTRPLRSKGSGVLSQWESARSLDELRRIQGSRYFTVNLESSQRHGTIEFRQQAATIEFDTVVGWVMFLHYLVELSKKKKATRFTFENIKNFTPVWLSTFLHNRAQDLKH